MDSGFGMTEVGFTHLPLLIEQCSLDSVGVAVKEYEQKVPYSSLRSLQRNVGVQRSE